MVNRVMASIGNVYDGHTLGVAIRAMSPSVKLSYGVAALHHGQDVPGYRLVHFAPKGVKIL